MRAAGRVLAVGAGWVARLLLIFYPPRFRREVGRELVADLRRGIRDQSAARGLGRAAAWAFRHLRSLAANVGPAWRDGTAQLVFEPPSPREGGRARLFTDLRSDLAYGGRQIARNPGFSAVALIILALGIGANTAIFSVVDALILRPLPFAHEGRLVSPPLFPMYVDTPPTAPGDVYPFLDELRSFDAFAAYTRARGVNLSGDGDPSRVEIAEVTPGFFPTLGVDLLRGRGFVDPVEERVVILSHRTWRDRFGSGDLVGRHLVLNGVAVTVVGIAPPGFAFPEAAEMWMPMSWGRDRVVGGSRTATTIARLAPGVTIEQGRAELELFDERHLTGTSMEGRVSQLRSLRTVMVGGTRTSLFVLLGATGLILLVACGNLANLFLTRAIARRQELSVRSSLGAGVGRLVRQLTTETLVLAMLGGLLGIALSYAVLNAVIALAPADFPRFATPRIDLRVLGFALGLSALTGIISGVWPAREGARVDLAEALKEGGGRHGGPLGSRRHGFLVVGQVGLTFVLLVAGGLLLQSLARLRAVDPGFRPEGALTVSISPTEEDPAARVRLLETILDRIRSLSGVEAAGSVNYLPLGTAIGFGVPIEVEGRGADEQIEEWPTLIYATDGYFEAMGVPVRDGRAFSDLDTERSQRVALVNASLAEAYWPGGSPVGERVRTSRDEGWATVVGVVGEVRTWSLTEEQPPQIYFAAAQAGVFPTRFVVRAADARALIPVVREAVRSVEPSLPVYGEATIEEVVAGQLAEQRFLSLLLTTFAALALVLAAVGLYGVLAYRVARRRHEIGVRLAFGARRDQILSLIIRHGLMLVGIGVLVGVAGAAAGTRVLRGLLYGVGEMDPVALIGAGVVLVLASVGACVLPAIRAAGVDPAVALRQ